MSDDENEGGGSGEGGHGGGGHGPGKDIGEVAEGVGGLAGGIADMIPEDEEGHEGEPSDAQKAHDGLETVETVADTAGKAVGGLDKLASGLQSGNASNIGGGVGGLTDAARYIVPEGEVRDVLGGVGQVARGLGGAIEGVRGVADRLGGLGGGAGGLGGGGANNVRYHVDVEGLDTTWHLRSLHYEDGIGALPTITIEAACEADSFLEETELFGKDVHVSIERGEEQRSLRGMVRRSFVHHGRDEQVVHMEVVPALWMLTQTMDSRVYQDITVPELVQKLFSEYLDPEHRKVRLELTEDYLDHEYLVQHRESHYAFMARLLDEEGIWFYFDHDSEDQETMVLCDSNDNRPRIREDHEGQIHYSVQENAGQEDEVAFHIQRRRTMGSTDAVVTGYDWTNPGAAVRHDRVERGDWRGPPLEVHDHHHALRHHGYDEGGGQYQSHTADRVSRMHTERLDLNRGQWSIQTSAIGVRPGHTFELVGADEHDGKYLITRVSAGGNPGATSGGFHATLDIIPFDMPYRPAAPARPSMPGPETAIVVGPAGEEIHTDKHGRVKVQFHWDRRGQRDEHSSVWIRVAQMWAGPGWGTMFIPRIGMEVVVSFLGGDPDRPIITGCVYNGQNPVPYQLPDHKTRSTIKTNSSLGGDGYNELRFEDKAGEEEVWIHAQKDFNEVVEHCHTTHVKVDQTNTVDHDQTETVGHDQTMHVKNDRTKTIDNDEWVEIGHYRSEIVHGNEDFIIEGQRSRTIKDDELLTVQQGKREIHVQTGKDIELFDGGRETTVKDHDNLIVDGGANRNTHVTGQYNIKSDGHFKIVQNSMNELLIDGKLYAIMNDDVELKAGNGAVHYHAKPDGKLEITAATEIKLIVGGSSITISSSEIKIEGPAVKVNATSANTEIDAAVQVKIKC